MKNISIYLLTFALTALTVSCKKNNPVVEPTDPKETTTPDKINAVDWNFDSFIVNNGNVSNIFPGAIFDLKKVDNNFELSSLIGKYTLLNITASTSIINSGKAVFDDIPSSEKIKNYVQDLPSQKGSVSGSYNEGNFKDYNIIKYYLGNNSDVKSVFEQLGINNSTRISKKNGLSLYTSSVRFTLDMSLPGNINLISPSEKDKLLGSYNPYYINGVSYGYNSLILVEGDADLALLKTAVKALINHQDLPASQAEALKNAKVTLYSRNGSSKTFIKVTANFESTKTALTELDTFNNNSLSYPVSYQLRSLKDFSLFKLDVKLNIIN